ncbi:MAG: chromosome partitioning protein, partial [Rhodobacteraceae bacterium]|nr:chromosome partitioning protein [Paracoccaceae bacterium]
MLRETESLPPYFNISPDQEASEIDAPLGTEDFGQIAEACLRGREDLRRRGADKTGRKTLRLF